MLEPPGRGLEYARVLLQAVSLKFHNISGWTFGNLRYCKTATSEAVVYFGGPAMGNGIFAMISLPSCLRKSSALLNPPSIFAIARTGEYFCPPVDAAISQSRSTSNVTCLRSHACFSLARKRPLVYLNKSSRSIGLPAAFQRRGRICIEGPFTPTRNGKCSRRLS
jgi:hypothetical protein